MNSIKRSLQGQIEGWAGCTALGGQSDVASMIESSSGLKSMVSEALYCKNSS